MEDNNKVATVCEAEAALLVLSDYPDDKCVTYGELAEIADRRPVVVSLPQGDNLDITELQVDGDLLTGIVS